MEEKNNVAIIGAGLIGLYLAWRLRRKGFEVTVFEKRDRVGQKPCSSLISERIKKFVPIPETLYQCKVDSILVRFPNKKIRMKVKPPFLLFERQQLDEFAFSLAKSEGVEIVFGKEMKEIPQGFSKIVGCDGSISKTRELLSLPSPNFRLGIQYFGEETSSEIEIWPKVFQNSPRYGFFWKIPKKGTTEYGAIGAKDFLKQEFEGFCREQNIDIEPTKLRAALVPQGICLPNSENITLCGDAAGLTKPTTGGGIIWGLYAANILIKNFSDFREYKREAERFFKPKILKGKAEVLLGYFIANHFPFFLPKNISIDADLF